MSGGEVMSDGEAMSVLAAADGRSCCYHDDPAVKMREHAGVWYPHALM